MSHRLIEILFPFSYLNNHSFSKTESVRQCIYEAGWRHLIFGYSEASSSVASEIAGALEVKERLHKEARGSNHRDKEFNLHLN